MTDEERKELRALCEAATPGPWFLATSNSWRRIIQEYTDKRVIEPTVHQYDRHPDLSAREEDLQFVVRARQAVPDLLDALDAKDAEIARLENLVGIGAALLQGEPNNLAKLVQMDSWLEDRQTLFQGWFLEEGKER